MMTTKFKLCGCSFLMVLSLLAAQGSALAQSPKVISTDPPTNSSVLALTFIDTLFNDNVSGVDASDLMINGVAATNMLVISPREYVFYFPAQPAGPVSVAWIAGHGIMDLSTPPNAFAGGSWSYTVDPNSVVTTFLISEFLTDNNSGIKDEDGSRQDWLEIYNPGADGNLAGWYLTDDSTNLTKWRFPAAPLGNNKYLLVWASGKNRATAGLPLHTNFKLGKDGGYLALVDPQTNVISAFAPYPPQQTDVSYGRDRIDPNLLGYFSTPTPGAQNTNSGPGVIGAPVFSVDTGIYTNSTLTLALSAPFGTIRYTLNGSLPLTNSPLYTGPITFGTNLIVKARVFPPAGSGLLPGPVGSRNYLFLDGTMKDFNSNLPLLIINTDGASIPADVPPGGNRTEGSLTVIDTFRGRSSILAKPDFQLLAGFEIFGQTSAGFNKKPIRIEIHDELGNDKDVPVLGMPAEADWRLRNPYDDKTMMNDYLGFELWEKMGHYSVRRRLVEVFVNSTLGVNLAGHDFRAPRLNYTTNYYGILCLTETIKQQKHRVDIAEITPAATNEPAITGGYIFKKDKDSTGDYNFSTAGGNGFPGEALKLHEPKPTTLKVGGVVGGALTPSGVKQTSWLLAYLNQMEKALYATNWLSLAGTNHYSNYLDVDSFVDFHWLVEFTKQIDGYRLSAYFTKDRNGKVLEGPVWDWNLSFGNANYLRGGTTDVWYYAEQDQGMTANEHIWLRRLLNGSASMGAGNALGAGGDPDFTQKAVDRWGVLRTNILNGPRMVAHIDELSTLLNEAATRNFAQYKETVGVYIWPNPDGTGDGRDVDFTHPTNYLGGVSGPTNSIIGQMKRWVTGRYNWIDSQITAAPRLDSVGGQVASGFNVNLTGPVGSVIYYTLDGSDPRGPGGVTNGTLYSGPITVTSNVRITARAKTPVSWYSTWSPPASSTYYLTVPGLRVTEIMYHPAPPPAGNTNAGSAFEYLELKNTGATPLDVQRFHLGSAVQLDFPSTVLAPGQSGVVVADIAAFQSRYGSGPLILGQYTGHLNNGGERVVLEGPVREPIMDFTYDDKWYPITDGFGFSLVAVNESALPEAWSTKAQWRPSGTLNGDPGQPNSSAPNIPTVVINEALTHSEPASDIIELRNLSATEANIGGWFLTDDRGNPKKYRIPDGTKIPANGYITFDESAFNVGGNGNTAFALSALGDELYIYSGDANTNLTGYVHGFDFGAQRNGVTFGRYVNSVGEEQFVTQISPTLNAANSGPLVGPIVITELMYRPPDVYLNGSFWNNPEDEFVELRNISGAAVPLYDPAAPSHTWKLDKAVQFSFPPGITIPAGGYFLAVNFDPNANASQAAAFRAKYSVPSDVPLFGPYGGNLDNSDDNVSLYMPDTPTLSGEIPYVLVDRVHYADQSPWETAADGLGPSLQKVVETAYGNDPANWKAVGPTAGSTFITGGTPPSILVQPKDTTAVGGTSATLTVSASGTPPLFYQWKFNGTPVPFANGPTLLKQPVKVEEAGVYSVTIYNPAGSIDSANAFLTVLTPVSIATHPLPVNLRGSTNNADYGFTTNNATFNVSASVQRPTTYQWRFNGVPIQGQTSTTLVVPNVGLPQDGLYDVVVTDDVSTATSNPARLKVLVTPQVLLAPLPQLVVSNGYFTASVVLRGNPPPYRYEWREVSTVRAANVSSEATNFFTYGPLTTGPFTNKTTLWRLVIFNDATPPAGVVASFNVVSALDSDGDGIPDIYETTYGLDPFTSAPPDQDTDHDGLTDYQEFLAGTDPTSAASTLKLTAQIGDNNTSLSFQAQPNKTYSVQYTDNLGAGSWTKLLDVTAQASVRDITVVDPGVHSTRFYLLVTPHQ